MAQERSIEVKVGILILVALGILGGFVLVMGGLSFEKTYAIFVDFDNPGGLQTGAPVRIAGVNVGKVDEMQFRGGKLDPKTNRRSMVRAKLLVQSKVRDTIHDDADFYVTTQGVLGEQFLAIEPGSPNHPVLDPETTIPKGIGPPRLDLFFAKAYELLDMTVTGLNNNKDLVKDIAVNTRDLLGGLSGAVTDNRERINRIMANLDSLTTEANSLTKDAHANYVSNPKVLTTIDNIEKITTDLKNDSGPLLKDAKEALANINKASQVVGDPEGQAKLKKTLADVSELASRANAIAADAQAIVDHIKKGEGTVGALVMDEELYDNLQEMTRDLKHNPWKFFWKN
ncbi:MAG TPA: MlaD family protein [Polyangiaceae bacterium]|nr:MlaD family protein [Polyangiaceae bacterium]